MHRPSNAAATCLLLLFASSCARWSQVEEPALGDSSAPAPAPEADAGVPDAEPPKLRAARRVLDTALTDSEGAPLGTLEDLWIVATSGDVAGVVVAPPADREEATIVAAYGALTWKRDGAAALAPVTASAAAEFFETRDYSELFVDQAASAVDGEITQIDSLAIGASQAFILKVRDEDNLLHRVFVEPAHLVARIVTALEVGGSVQAEGVLTRDGTGKLLIAGALGRGERTLTFRGPGGAIRWDALAEPFQSARDLLGRSVRLTDGTEVPIHGWLLDWASGRVVFLVVDVDGVERALPWSRVRRVGKGLEFQSDRPSLAALSAVSPEGLAPEL